MLLLFQVLLVPIHFAFDLAEAVTAATHRTESAERDPARRVLALLTGHQDGSGPAARDDPGGDHKHHHECAVCAAFGTLAGFAPAAVVPTVLPLRIQTPILFAASDNAAHTAAAAAYRSRAPPIGTADLNT